MPSVEIKGDFAALRSALVQLRDRAPELLVTTAADVIEETGRFIRKAYLGVGSESRAVAPIQPIARGTEIKRQYGKIAGQTPAAAPTVGNMPFIDTFGLARDGGPIEHELSGGVKGLRFAVHVAPGSQTPRGVPYTKIAAMLESGVVATIEITPRMRAYLHRLFREAGLPQPSASSGSRGIALVIPPRPVWERTYKALLQSATSEQPVFPQLAFSKIFIGKVARFIRGRMEPAGAVNSPGVVSTSTTAPATPAIPSASASDVTVVGKR